MEITTIKNIRDLGTISNLNEKKIKENKIFRSGALNKLSKKDLDSLVNDYNVKKIIDLRNDVEIEEKPDVLNGKIEYVNIPMFDKSLISLLHNNKKLKEKISMIEDMKVLYQRAIENEFTKNAIYNVINEIINSDESVLFHCSIGKDRTGIIAALILEICGIDRNLIYKDYSESDKYLIHKSNLVYLGVKLITLDKEKAVRIKNVYRARKEYIEFVYLFIESKYGSLENYIENELKIDKEMQNKLRRKLLIKV